MPDYEPEDAVLSTLAQDFPDVPRRVLSEVLAAYLRESANLAEAAEATRARIADACAT